MHQQKPKHTTLFTLGGFFTPSGFWRIISCIALLSLFSCDSAQPGSPESRLRDTLQSIEQAAEARSLSKFMQHISDDYQDHKGNDKDQIRKIMQLQYIRNQNIHILAKVTELVVDGNSATVELSAAMAGNEVDLQGDFSKLRADSYQFSVALVSPDQQQTWLVESVSWKRGWD